VRINWPDDLSTRYIILADTEWEFDWSAPLTSEHRTTSAVTALLETHVRFADHNIPLGHLIDYPIVTDPQAVDIL